MFRKNCPYLGPPLRVNRAHVGDLTAHPANTASRWPATQRNLRAQNRPDRHRQATSHICRGVLADFKVSNATFQLTQDSASEAMRRANFHNQPASDHQLECR